MRVVRKEVPDDLHLLSREGHCVLAVGEEGLIGIRDPVAHDVGDRLGVAADLELGMGIDAQLQEVEEVVEVRLPVPFRVDIGRQDHPGSLTSQSITVLILAEEDLVFLKRKLTDHLDTLLHAFGVLGAELTLSTLVVVRGLVLQLIQLGDVELLRQHRIASRDFVDAGGPVANPLTGDEDRQLHMQLDLAHLERCRVLVAQQVRIRLRSSEGVLVPAP